VGRHELVSITKRGWLDDAYFTRYDEGTKKYTFISPLFEGDVEMGLGPVEIDEGGQDDRHFYFGSSEDIIDHGGKCRSFRVP
jgi:hypothetical protein